MPKRNDDLTWYSGSICETNQIDFQNFFLYHIPKTGGVSFTNSIRYALEFFFSRIAASKPEFIPPHSLLRIDTSEALKQTNIEGYYPFIATHLAYGTHKSFNHPYQLVTFLRDPYRRILSAYTYQSMRKNSPPTEQGFVSFYQAEKNRNCSVKQLTGLSQNQTVPHHQAKQAQKNLEDEFSLYGTTRHLSEIISQALKINFLPNVLSERLNNTDKDFQLDGSSFKKEIEELNAPDLELYRFVQSNPNLGENIIRKPNQTTIVIQQIQNDTEGVLIQHRPIATERVVPFLQNESCSNEAVQQLFAEPIRR